MNLYENFITTESAAEILFVSSYTVREYIKAGKLKATKVGKRYLINKDDVDELFRSHAASC